MITSTVKMKSPWKDTSDRVAEYLAGGGEIFKVQPGSALNDQGFYKARKAAEASEGRE